MAPHTDLAAVLESLGEIKTQLGLLTERVGEEKDGGSGLVRRVMRAETKLDDVIQLKSKVVGAIAALGVFSSLLFLGAKAWVEQLAGVHHP